MFGKPRDENDDVFMSKLEFNKLFEQCMHAQLGKEFKRKQAAEEEKRLSQQAHLSDELFYKWAEYWESLYGPTNHFCEGAREQLYKRDVAALAIGDTTFEFGDAKRLTRNASGTTF